MLYYSYPQIVLTEVPDEISLALSISGCPMRCHNCHSQETYNPTFGKPLTYKELRDLIRNNQYITCVLFYGGEWESDYLHRLLCIVKQMGLKTCLYSGNDILNINPSIIRKLNYLKYGMFNETLGPLDSKTTNQHLLNLDTNKDITYKFQK